MAGFIGGLMALFSLKAFGLMCVGMLTGIIFGALPGLTAVMAIALLMPLTFFMPLNVGLPMLLAVYCGGIYGGSITACLIRTPGTPASAATTLEGYPMAQKGRPGEALSTAVWASWFGGVFSVICLTFFAPLLGKAALAFGPIEYFALILVGIILIGYLSGKSMVKSLIAASLGFLMASIGLDPVLGLPRFHFGNVNLYSGISIIPTVIGLFAFCEVFNMIKKINEQEAEIRIDQIRYIKLREFFGCAKNLIKSSLIGTVIGSIPAVGSSTAGWLAYGEEKRSSKHPELFGTGIVDGIVAVESANNAVTGGALIPLLSLGIPGDPVTAILLGGLIIQGIRPGPTFFIKSMDTGYIIFAAMFLANFLMLFFGLAGVKFFTKALRIPKSILALVIFILSIVGCYAINNNIFDVKIAVILGIVAYILEKWEIPIPPVVLALVLAPMFEQNLRRALIMTDGSIIPFFTSPIAIGFYLFSILLIYGLVRKEQKTKATIAQTK
jgi:putative tricarboxylic transport membrane protein